MHAVGCICVGMLCKGHAKCVLVKAVFQCNLSEPHLNCVWGQFVNMEKHFEVLRQIQPSIFL